MNMKLKTILLQVVFLVLMSTVPLSAESYQDILAGVDAAVIQQLDSHQEVFRYDKDSFGLSFLPEGKMTADIVRSYNSLNPNILTEALYIIPYTDTIDSININLYRLLTDVEKISDVVYHSHRRDAYVPLFDDVYPIESATRRKRIELPPIYQIPEINQIYLHMKEVNFGSAHYSLEYSYQDGGLLLTLKNVTVIRKFIKVADREEFDIKLYILPSDEGFLVYGLCQVKLSNEDLVRSMLEPYSAFYRRMYALETWIYNTLHETDRKPDMGKPYIG